MPVTMLAVDRNEQNIETVIATGASVSNRTGVSENSQYGVTNKLSIPTLKKIVTHTLDNEDERTNKEKNLFSNGKPREKSYNKIVQACFDIFFNSLLAILYCVFAIYRYNQYIYNRIKIRIFNFAYNPSNTPQLIRRDVKQLSKIPKLLAAILEFKSEEEVGGGVLGLMDGSSDLVAWTLSSGIKQLVLYDYDGILKNEVELLRVSVYNKLSKYYGPDSVPKFAIRIPRTDTIYFNAPTTNTATATTTATATANTTNTTTNTSGRSEKRVSIEVLLLSNVDGRETIVELTRTMAELCSKKEISIDEISMDLVDQNLIQLVGNEPDLLLYFGPNLDLQGYPPWHIRLTEFYWEPDNDEVSYSVFIRGLKKYANCKINVGK